MDFKCSVIFWHTLYLNHCKYSFTMIYMYFALIMRLQYVLLHMYMQVKYCEISMTCFILFARVHMQLYSKEKASKLDKCFTKIKLTVHWHECRQFTSQLASESILHALQTRILTQLIKGLQPQTKQAIILLPVWPNVSLSTNFSCFSLKILLLVSKSEILRGQLAPRFSFFLKVERTIKGARVQASDCYCF